jgi:hypothetical protein
MSAVQRMTKSSFPKKRNPSILDTFEAFLLQTPGQMAIYDFFQHYLRQWHRILSCANRIAIIQKLAVIPDSVRDPILVPRSIDEN